MQETRLGIQRRSALIYGRYLIGSFNPSSCTEGVLLCNPAHRIRSIAARWANAPKEAVEFRLIHGYTLSHSY